MSEAPILPLGRELDRHGTPRGVVGLPAPVWNQHLLVCGATGTGKTTTVTHAIEHGHASTDGCTIVIDPKGAGWPTDLLRSHYAETGSLDDVLYFDASEFLPAFSVFDIRPDIEAGVSRLQAVQTVADHFIELLDHVKPAGFDAIRAPDVVRHLMLALYDPVHGADAFPLSELVEAIYRLRRSETVPEVEADWAEDLLASLTDGTRSSRQQILQGAITRVEKFYGDSHLRPMFEVAPEDPGEAFDLGAWLDRDALIIFDLGGLSDRGQRVVAITVLSMLWRALQRRSTQAEPTATHDRVLLAIDELATLGIESLLPDLLSMGREYGLCAIPMLQYPSQLAQTTGEERAADELINNVQSVLAGRVPEDERLIQRLSDGSMSSGEVRNRLASLRADRWLFRPATPRGIETIATHLLADLPLPSGHPDGPAPLSDDARAAFERARERCLDRTRAAHSVDYEPYTHAALTPESDSTPSLSEETRAALDATGYTTTLPLVESLPGGVTYDAERHAVVCDACGHARPATLAGLLAAIQCHGTLAAVDREAIPPIELGVTLDTEAMATGSLAPIHFCALQLIQNVAAGTYTTVEFDRVHDPLQDMLAQFGITTAHLETLQDAGLITRDQLHRYVFYTPTAAGRERLDLAHRRGVDWGHRTGDLTESLLHAVMVEGLARLFEHDYVADPDSAVTDVNCYYELDAETLADSELHGGTRLDVVGLDRAGRIRIAGEAECYNHDAAVAPLQDYDQLAALDLEAAWWIVPSSTRGHQAVLQPLADPPTAHEALDDTSPRISGYSTETRIEDISEPDAPGMTDIVTLNEVRKAVPTPSLSEFAGADAA